MKKITELFKKIKKNDFLRIIIELISLLFLFNINEYIGLVLLLLIVVEIVLSKNVEDIISIFLFLSYNDEVLKMDILKGSISRVVMIVIALKLIYHIIKNKIPIQKKHIFITIFFLISCLVSITNIIEEGIVFLNIFIFVLFSIVASHDIKKKDKFIEKICLTIVISVLCSIIYGLLTANFLEYVQNEKTMYRFNGTYEPNFMCMYINMAILSLITIKDKFKKWAYYLIFAIFLNAVILTMSMTGLISLCVCLFIYVIMFRKQWKELLLRGVYIFIISGLMLFGIKQINTGKYVYWVKNNGIANSSVVNQNNNNKETEDFIDMEKNYYDEDQESGNIEDRFERIKYLLLKGKFDILTSGRTALIRSFAKASFNRSFFRIMFGNNLLNKKVYSSFFNRECYSHNTFIDFLYNFGIVGFCIIVWYIFYTTIKNKFLNECIVSSKYVKNIKLIRIMLIIFALSLTLYPKRMILIFFLL